MTSCSIAGSVLCTMGIFISCCKLSNSDALDRTACASCAPSRSGRSTRTVATRSSDSSKSAASDDGKLVLFCVLSAVPFALGLDVVLVFSVVVPCEDSVSFATVLSFATLVVVFTVTVVFASACN